MLERGIDVHDCFGPHHMRTLDWRRVFRLKDRLPRDGHYKTAVAMNRELAKELIKQPESKEPPTPLGYSLDTYYLMSIADLLQAVQSAVIAAAGGKPPGITPLKRPRTALDIEREEQWKASMNKMIDLFTTRVSDEQDPDTNSW